MQDNRNSSCGGGTDNTRGTVCISTNRVLDACRDRDCFEDSRVYLTAYGEEIIANATNVRTKSARTLWAFVGVEEVPFNCGFFQVKVRYYIEVELEACVGMGRSQTFKGLAMLEKDVVLYGGEGSITSFSSDNNSGFCSIGDPCQAKTNDPVAVVESVEPIVLSTKVKEYCPCSCSCDCCDLPETVRGSLDGELVTNSTGPRLYVSFGIFSVIRIERPAQLLVQATDYSVPDKECTAATNNENPCELFRTISFPVTAFQSNFLNGHDERSNTNRSGGCGCGRNN